MRWLCDENVPRNLVSALRRHGHDVVWIREESPGMPDGDVLARAVGEHRVCLTFDKDFGQLASSTPIPPDTGIVLLRLSPPKSHDLAQSIIAVIEPGRIRIRPLI